MADEIVDDAPAPAGDDSAPGDEQIADKAPAIADGQVVDDQDAGEKAPEADDDAAAAVDADGKEKVGDEVVDDAAKAAVETPELKEAQTKVSSLEGEITPLRALDAKVQEIGGLATLEMAKPVLDVMMDPGATSEQIFSTLEENFPHLNAQDLAWGLLENPKNQEALAERLFGAGVTPALLEELVTAHRDGKISLDAEDDNPFDSPEDKALRAKDRTEREAWRKEQADTRRERETTRQAALKQERDTGTATMAQKLTAAVDEVLGKHQLTLTPEDEKNPEVKKTKTFVVDSTRKILMAEFSGDPTYQRVLQLIEKNGVKAALALTDGTVVRAIMDRTAELAKEFEPLVEKRLGKITKQAEKIKQVRQEPGGALDLSETGKKAEQLSGKDPQWREKLDAEYEQKFKDAATAQRRTATGQFR